jgi:SAM-dependent methyltransferase
VTHLERLSEQYGDHHRSRGPNFVWGGSERVGPICSAVGGPGRRVLDLGCRYGALTRFYAAENDVVGLDVDRVALAEASKLGIGTVWADAEERLPF